MYNVILSLECIVQGRLNNFEIGGGVYDELARVLRGRAREGVDGGGGADWGGLPQEKLEIYDTCRCILSHCWNILFSFFYRDFVN